MRTYMYVPVYMCVHASGHSYDVCVDVREQSQVWILRLPLVRDRHYCYLLLCGSGQLWVSRSL